MNPHEWALCEVTPCPVSWVPESWDLVLSDRACLGPHFLRAVSGISQGPYDFAYLLFPQITLFLLK